MKVFLCFGEGWEWCEWVREGEKGNWKRGFWFVTAGEGDFDFGRQTPFFGARCVVLFFFGLGKKS